MTIPTTASPFIDTAAVEAWDAWFRWREPGCLHDVTVDMTWDRVASALASVELRGRRVRMRQEFLDAFSSWQLLLDERILAGAGTPSLQRGRGDPVAVLNLAAFVKAPFTQQASIDLTAIEDIAMTAVRALDNATLLGGQGGARGGLRIGVIGLGDAFKLVGTDYCSSAAAAKAKRIVHALSCGATEGSIALARERGHRFSCGQEWLDRAFARGLPQDLITDAARIGLRYTALTAISSQPKLALFANGVSDALEPAPNRPVAHVIDEGETPRVVYPVGYARSVAMRLDKAYEMTEHPDAASRLAIHEAIRPWMDQVMPGIAISAMSRAFSRG